MEQGRDVGGVDQVEKLLHKNKASDANAQVGFDEHLLWFVMFNL